MDETSDLDRQVDASMRLFERAHVGSADAMTPIRPSRVLLALDGSTQDATSAATAKSMREHFNTETIVLDARESAGPTPTSELATDTAAGISGARAIARPDGEAFDAILAALKTHTVDLVIVPSPFGRSFEKVGEDSVGTVIDVLLSRCGTPMWVTRRDDQDFDSSRKRVSVLVGSECDVESRAAAWAFGLAGPGADVSLNLIVEKEHFENIRSIVEAMQPGETLDADKLSDALIQTHQKLHGAMSKTAHELGLGYHMLPQTGELSPPNPLNKAMKQLLVIPLEVDDRFTQGFVHDRIRRSPHPVLVVPGHVMRS